MFGIITLSRRHGQEFTDSVTGRGMEPMSHARTEVFHLRREQSHRQTVEWNCCLQLIQTSFNANQDKLSEKNSLDTNSRRMAEFRTNLMATLMSPQRAFPHKSFPKRQSSND